MPWAADLHYDVSSAIGLGQREYQEDALALDFPLGAGLGFAVLADGMGGHAAGDVASKIVVTEVFSDLKLHSGDPEQMETRIEPILRQAAAGANDVLRHHAETCPDTRGMGATLIAPVILQNRLYWISVGDSPLYLYRAGTLARLNQDHSLVPQIDYLVSKGLMGEDEGLHHPDRNCLTSVLIGQPIPKIDCPHDPVRLFEGDVILAASDGVQVLEDSEILGVLNAAGDQSAAEIGAALMRDITSLDDPDQDNVSLCVIRVCSRLETRKAVPRPNTILSEPAPEPRKVTRKSVTVMAALGRQRGGFGCHMSTVTRAARGASETTG